LWRTPHDLTRNSCLMHGLPSLSLSPLFIAALLGLSVSPITPPSAAPDFEAATAPSISSAPSGALEDAASQPPPPPSPALSATYRLPAALSRHPAISRPPPPPPYDPTQTPSPHRLGAAAAAADADASSHSDRDEPNPVKQGATAATAAARRKHQSPWTRRRRARRATGTTTTAAAAMEVAPDEQGAETMEAEIDSESNTGETASTGGADEAYGVAGNEAVEIGVTIDAEEVLVDSTEASDIDRRHRPSAKRALTASSSYPRRRAATTASLAPAAPNDTSAPAPAGSPTAALPKRPRGRPPKVRVASRAAATAAPRRRGRPKRSAAASVANMASRSTCARTDAASPPPPSPVPLPPLPPPPSAGIAPLATAGPDSAKEEAIRAAFAQELADERRPHQTPPRSGGSPLPPGSPLTQVVVAAPAEVAEAAAVTVDVDIEPGESPADAQKDSRQPTRPGATAPDAAEQPTTRATLPGSANAAAAVAPAIASAVEGALNELAEARPKRRGLSEGGMGWCGILQEQCNHVWGADFIIFVRRCDFCVWHDDIGRRAAVAVAVATRATRQNTRVSEADLLMLPSPHPRRARRQKQASPPPLPPPPSPPPLPPPPLEEQAARVEKDMVGTSTAARRGRGGRRRGNGRPIHAVPKEEAVPSSPPKPVRRLRASVPTPPPPPPPSPPSSLVQVVHPTCSRTLRSRAQSAPAAQEVSEEAPTRTLRTRCTSTRPTAGAAVRTGRANAEAVPAPGVRRTRAYLGERADGSGAEESSEASSNSNGGSDGDALTSETSSSDSDESYPRSTKKSSRRWPAQERATILARPVRRPARAIEVFSPRRTRSGLCH